MTRTFSETRTFREVAFVDPGIADIETLLAGLRPDIAAIVLDPDRPAAHQIAAALGIRPDSGRDLDAIHIVAHGAPGRVNFTAGEWAEATIADDAADLAQIGRVLGPDGELCLWSCDTSAGIEGADFVERLAQATGVAIAAASGRIGAAAQGGSWQLTARSPRAMSRPPLTTAGIAAYAGVMAAVEVTVTGTLPSGNTTGTVTYFIIDKSSNTIVGQVMLPDAAKQNNSVAITVKVPSSTGSFAVGTFGDEGNFQPSGFLRVNAPPPDQRPSGAVGR
jgi:hypothetical protein